MTCLIRYERETGGTANVYLAVEELRGAKVDVVFKLRDGEVRARSEPLIASDCVPHQLMTRDGEVRARSASPHADDL